ncbi:GPN-loop GTPase 1 [Sphaeroforma arctica JP610]|uniref:GPN-loop GTPase n=1 Tax=Sphaeroforma arctica JP610 TaxID=667725 RepID=A0A0L0FIG3_9EUKA|nr:GPN-loop GTPase 1 [Sphaeroforma arctica JP610]KNC76545.1 GPN-loop GTPase 1 [Sphaeroforma arctica JP610]|eukprot:XP_014150447.1 GPN-loop GTPase 1 [Sphaeroforma arctica JP610]
MPYVINLDPAVKNLGYAPNIDIRDTINYKEVMKQYQLGPNGGILTSLNLFATRFEKVLEIIDKRATQVDYTFVDTPGQIEIFTWSASGAVITESLASTFPTVVVYVIDTPRCVSPITFVSNMLYACSIMYKTRLPMVIALNKADVVDTEFVEEWMTDFDALQDALAQDDSYMSSLSRSMGMVLEEFYNHMQSASVSAVTGQGIEEFFTAVDAAVEEYDTIYKPELERIKKEREGKQQQERDEQMERIQRDMGKNGQTLEAMAMAKREEEGSEESGSDDDEQREVDAFDRFITTQK